MIRRHLAIAATCALSGCVPISRYPPVQPATEADGDEAQRPIVCAGTDQCALWWRRAQLWIARNSGYKLQVISDTVLETYGARPGSTSWAFSATREPLGEGREQIELDPSCGSQPQCTQNALTLRADFSRYVRAGS